MKTHGFLLNSSFLVSQVVQVTPATPWGTASVGCVGKNAVSATCALSFPLCGQREDGSCQGLGMCFGSPDLKSPITDGTVWPERLQSASKGDCLLLEISIPRIVTTLCPLSFLQACSVKRTLTTVLVAPTALTVVSVWIGSGATLAAACLALQESGARETSTSASPTPAAPRAAWTAYSWPMTTCASAAAPSPVRAPCRPSALPPRGFACRIPGSRLTQVRLLPASEKLDRLNLEAQFCSGSVLMNDIGHLCLFSP